MSNLEKTMKADDLLQRLKDGDNAAFTDLVRENWDKVFSRAYGLLKNREDAEEVTQDTFVRARNGVNSFRGECSTSTWLHRIATNLARNKYWYWWRRKRGESMSLDAQMSEGSDSTFADVLPCSNPTPADSALTSEFSDLLPKAIASLDDKYAQILRMRSEKDMSYEQIAKELNLTVGTVKSRLSRAREQLREAIAKMS